MQCGAESALPVDDVFAPESVEEVVVFEREVQAGADFVAEPGVDGAVLPRPSMRSVRPFARCCSIAYSSAMRTGSLVVMSVVEVVRMMRSVCAAMAASRVVGLDEKNGGLWCSPTATTSRPTCSAFLAMVTKLRMRSASLGVRPVVGSRVTSLTDMIPNCIGWLLGWWLNYGTQFYASAWKCCWGKRLRLPVIPGCRMELAVRDAVRGLE